MSSQLPKSNLESCPWFWLHHWLGPSFKGMSMPWREDICCKSRKLKTGLRLGICDHVFYIIPGTFYLLPPSNSPELFMVSLKCQSVNFYLLNTCFLPAILLGSIWKQAGMLFRDSSKAGDLVLTSLCPCSPGPSAEPKLLHSAYICAVNYCYYSGKASRLGKQWPGEDPETIRVFLDMGLMAVNGTAPSISLFF